jgi:adenylate cyclase class 2
MRNIEYKAELRDLPLARTIARSLGAQLAETMQQTDTYYRIADAKLKRRDIVWVEQANYGQQVVGADTLTEFIHYQRPEAARPRASDYTVLTPDQARARFGETPLPVWTVVKKMRELYLYKGVRIHLDRVENLGAYIEFEAPVTAERPEPDCRAALAVLLEGFRPVMGEAIGKGYADLQTGCAAGL